MKDEKRNKIAVAITVNMVLLVYILVAIVIAQIVQISVLSRRKQELQETYYILQVEKEKAESVDEMLAVDKKYEKWLLEYIDVWGNEDPLGVLPNGVTTSK